VYEGKEGALVNNFVTVQVGLSDLIEKGYWACIKEEAELQVELRLAPVNLLLKGWLLCLLLVSLTS
jgi:hypothetical protein